MSVLRPDIADEQRHSPDALWPALLLSLALHAAAGSWLLALARPRADPPQGLTVLTVRLARTPARSADGSPPPPPLLESAASSLRQDLASLPPPALAAIPEAPASPAPAPASSPERQAAPGRPRKARPSPAARHARPKPAKLNPAPPADRVEAGRTSMSKTAGPEAPAPQLSAHAASAGRPPAQPSGPFIAAHYNADYLHNPTPEYPLIARRLGLQGTVKLKVLVSAQGIAQEVRLSESSGSEVLDGAAVESVRHWRFVPAQRGDTTLASWVEVPVRFVLR
jgi:protein TonB